MATPLLAPDSRGLFCEVGGFYIDPWKPVDRAVVTHGHSDHASWGHRRYLCTPASAPILRRRLGNDCPIDSLPFRETVNLNGVQVSFHPAGHVLGSAQVRLEYRGEVWVVTGDYKTERDRTAEPFELVPCHTLITETTFGLPIFQWRPQAEVFDQINAWWRANQKAGKASVLMGYALGKAQRLLGGVDAELGPIFAHGSVAAMNETYREGGVALPATRHPASGTKDEFARALIIAPPSAQGTPWMRRFGDVSTAFASGWMTMRGTRRRRALDRGFILSDHVDWTSLMEVIRASGAETVLTTHGYADIVARHLREQGLNSRALATAYVGEAADSGSDAEEEFKGD